MGVVYRARDPRLQRDVALKLLPDHFAGNPDRLARFQREAQVLASLNHPNIAQIYGLEQAGNVGCIVMELVEGQTLAERVKAGPLPIGDAIGIARQVAGAVAAAHERSVTHRDLKPANIKLAPDGTVKVLDFGLAKIASGMTAVSSEGAGFSNSPTMMSGSAPGVILGTAAYMSPEQARGKEVDARTDIWAFGCVLYEMLTGRPAFSGETVTDIIAKIVAGQPEWDRLPDTVPEPVRMLLTAALTKDPRQRLQAIGDARLFLDSAFTPLPSPQAPIAPRRLPGWFVPAVIGIAYVAALVPATLYFLGAPQSPEEVQFEMPAPGILPLSLTISPDGRRIAYLASTEGRRAIWIRPMGSLTAHPLPGTENAIDAPFWSPDSAHLGFVADGKLKRISASGGAVQELSDGAFVVGLGAWGRDGSILFTRIVNGAPEIVRIADTGGVTAAVTRIDPAKREGFAFAPQFLPDGRHFLYHRYSSSSPETSLYVGSLESKTSQAVMNLGEVTATSGNSPAHYVAPGYLLFYRNRTLMAQPFDAGRLTLSDDPVVIAENVRGFDASENGILVYRNNPGAPTASTARSELLWFERDGKPAGRVPAPPGTGSVALSRDRKPLRVAVTDFQGALGDIWVIDIARSVPVKVTTDPRFEFDPVWNAEGDRLLFSAVRRVPALQLFQIAPDGTGMEEPVSVGDPKWGDGPGDWSRDGRHVIFPRARIDVGLVFDLWMLPLSGEKKPVPYLRESPFNETHPQFSPDGRYVAYATNQSGTYQIVVQTFPDPLKDRWQITANGGAQPRWRGDGRELFYLGLDAKLMAVEIQLNPDFEPGQPKELFQTSIPLALNTPERQYDVTADGKRFLTIPESAGLTDTSNNPIIAVVNWAGALRDK
jgi:Tol biopolymer transport system component